MRDFQNGGPKGKATALKDVSVTLYSGGNIIEQYILKDPRVIDLCLNAIADEEDFDVRLQAIQLLSVMCQSGPPILEALYKINIFERLVTMLSIRNELLCKWALHSLFMLVVRNFERYKKQLDDPQIQVKVCY
ncbi:hypothetical protein BC833DRAFT_326886 [Globomyces pollinis-pini]|nr:hypothetical protein BC833DRAFT_326886 [Globomyces pollinis-pini]